MITYRKLHNIKLEQQYVKPIIEKEKTFEIRYNDRDYKVGDIIRFKPTTDSYYGDFSGSIPVISSMNMNFSSLMKTRLPSAPAER